MNRKIKAAAIQQPPVFLNLNASIEKAEMLCREAADENSELIVFPETWLPGYPFWIDSAPNAAVWDYPPSKKIFSFLFDNTIEMESKQFKKLKALAKDTGAYLVFGVNEKRGNTIYNSQVIFDKNGTDFNIHRKLVPTYTERMIWGRGDGSTLKSLQSDFGNIGGLICWEHWMPFARAAMHAQNEVVHIAQWPSVRELHMLASRHYAFEGQCFVIASGMTVTKLDLIEGIKGLNLSDSSILDFINSIPMQDSDFIVNGGSAMIAPNSEFVAQPVYNTTQTVFAELDLDMIGQGNQYLDTDGHYSRPDIFTLNVDSSEQKNVKFREEKKI